MTVPLGADGWSAEFLYRFLTVLRAVSATVHRFQFAAPSVRAGPGADVTGLTSKRCPWSWLGWQHADPPHL